MRELSDRERREAAKWVTRMLDRPDRYRAGLEAWLADHPERSVEYNRLLNGVHGLTGSAEARYGYKRSGEQRAVPRPMRASHLGWRSALGVAAAILVTITFATRLFTNDLRSGEGTGGAQTRIATRIGEVRPETLKDGTQVTLDTGTVLDFSPNGRTVLLQRGRARFDVAPSQSGPAFTVIGGNNRVIVKSGVFDVSDRGDFSAQVVEGNAVVRLRPAAYLSTVEHDVQLAAGQKLVLTGLQRAHPSVIAARPSDAQWIGGVKSFDDVPIKEVIAEANTYSAKKIVLADPALGERGIFGDLYIRDIEAVATGIANFLHLDVDRSQPGKLILVARN